MEYFIIGIIIGAVCDIVQSAIRNLRRTVGTLQVDNSNLEEPVWRINLNDRVRKLNKKKKIVLLVEYIDDLSQK